jgi:DeoR family glycerol-3-phosphate regulon repressor
MDILSSRQNKILMLAGRNGKVDVEHLSADLGVSPQTIRKDLNILCDRQLLQRIHGGAIVGSGIENVSYEARRLLSPESKKAIGIKAATLIPDNSSLPCLVKRSAQFLLFCICHTGADHALTTAEGDLN